VIKPMLLLTKRRTSARNEECRVHGKRSRIVKFAVSLLALSARGVIFAPVVAPSATLRSSQRDGVCCNKMK
jgi:hypothetical protein